MIGITAPYGEVYLKNHNREFCDMENHCNMDSSSETNSNTNTPRSPFCPLCPSMYSFNPYLPNGGEILFIPQLSSLLPTPLETIKDQGYVPSIFRPPTSIL